MNSLTDTGFLFAVLNRKDIRHDACTLALEAEILEKYADSKIDYVDAVIMAIAERLEIKRILTVDRRDFSLFRPKHCDAFEIIP